MSMRTLTLTLPVETVDELEARVAAGLALDVETGIALAVEQTREDGLEDWVRSEGIARATRVRIGTERTMTYDEVMAEIDGRYQQRLD